MTGGKPIAVLLQSISGVSAINPLVAFYNINGGKREVLFFYFVPDTRRDSENFKLLLQFTLFKCYKVDGCVITDINNLTAISNRINNKLCPIMITNHSHRK
jgi:hypothetical protein